MIFRHLLTMFCFLNFTAADIHIWEPPSLKMLYTLDKLDYTIANFG